MKKYYVTINLIKSEKWRQFLKSTAVALHTNLVFFDVGTKEQFSACDRCAICGSTPQPFSAPAAAETKSMTGDRDAQSQEPDIFRLDEKYAVAVRNHPCCHAGSAMEFHEKASIARALLVNFYDVLINPLNEGQRTSGLTALHQMNHIILSVFRGDHNAPERVIDLVLSAALILFDAEGSWLEYTAHAQQHLQMTGNCVLSSDSAASIQNKALTVEVYSPVIHGILGILKPVDLARVNDGLDLIINECIHIFEVDKLLRLMEANQFLILNAVGDTVLLVDRRKNICFANKAASELLNHSIQELFTLSVFEIDGPWRDCISSETGEVTKGVKALLMSDSGERYIDWEVCPLARGIDIPGWLIIARDRTDFYCLQELREKVENSIHNSKMLNVVAHEIRNPLATFKGLFQIINLKSASPEISKYVTIGLNEIDKLTLMLDEFSQFGKAAAISLKKTDLKSFIEEVIILINAGFDGPDMEIDTSIETVKPVFADKRQLTQVLFNLVKNAAEALDYKGKITLCLRQYDEYWVEINVSDNGPGISDKIKDKIFTQYFSTKIDGAGLGLAITSSIVGEHNGKISCYNLPTGGACFSILLPAYNTNNDTQKQDRGRIMIVTNDDLLRLQSERLFKEENISFYSIKKHDSVLSIIEKNKPQIIFIDDIYLNVNILNKLLGNIISDYPDIKILIAGDRIRKAHGHVFHILKPLNYAKLMDAVKSLLK